MTWTNAFDIGSCTVAVHAYGIQPEPYFSQVMAKGDSAGFTLDYVNSGQGMTISVSSTGEVNISATDSADVASIGVFSAVTVCVIPSYAITGLGLRASSILAGPGAVFGFVAADSGALPDFPVQLTAFAPVAPDPADVSGLDGTHDSVSIALGILLG